MAICDGWVRLHPAPAKEDAKRMAIAQALIDFLGGETDIDNVFSCSDVMQFYDYIEAGKIPLIKLTD